MTNRQKLLEDLLQELLPWVSGFREDISEASGYTWIMVGTGFDESPSGEVLRLIDVEPDNGENHINICFSLTSGKTWVVEFSASCVEVDEDDENYEEFTQLNANAKAAMFAVFGNDFVGLAYTTPEEAFEQAMECAIQLLGALNHIEDDDA